MAPVTAADRARRLHDGCIACGDTADNPHSLALVFTVVDGEVAARFRPAPHHRGYAGRLHGGLIATLLDAAMTHCLFARGIAAVTAEMSIRFVAPAAIDRELRVTARLVAGRRRFARLVARLADGERTLAQATATFMPAPELEAALPTATAGLADDRGPPARPWSGQAGPRVVP